MPADLENKIDRLTRLIGTDEGFYILALHSFVEYFLRYERGYGEGPAFPELTWSFREELPAERGDTFIEGLSCLARLGSRHHVTNKVRHAFELMDAQEAAAATHLFLTFCKLAEIERTAQLHTLARNLDIWKPRTSLIQTNTVLGQMQRELERLQKKNRSLLEQRTEYEKLKGRLVGLQGKLVAHDLEIQKTREVARHRGRRLTGLRQERNALIQERNGLHEKMREFEDLEKYLRYLGRLSLYTRTRMDYERSISELTPEQEQVVDSIKLKRDFLIKGGAGTGKSLVLIECLRRAAMQNELDFGAGETVVFVTFTRTPAKYNRYIAEIMGSKIPLDVISTVDRLFYLKLRELEPQAAYNFDLLENYFDRAKTPGFFSPEELISEIENFLFAGGVSEAEYLEQMKPRTGMRRRLSREQRREVWRTRQAFVEHMESSKLYTKNYGQCKLPAYLRAHPEDRRIRNISHLFLDEVQDLTPVGLMILRELTRGAMVMAGDVDQSLYSFQSPLARAQLKLQGTTRILKTNFRNTGQLHSLSERFRRRCTKTEWDSTTCAFAFRDGPVPELYTAAGRVELQDLLLRKLVVFLQELGYEPETVCILVPRNVEIGNLTEYIESRSGYKLVNIAHEEFDFKQTGKVRISTLHSSKGLDFPVVLLYLPYLHRRAQYNTEQTEKLLRNLVYVAVTRAMDNLNVFACDTDSEDPVLADLRACFQQ